MTSLLELSEERLRREKPALDPDFDFSTASLTPEQAFLLSRVDGHSSLHEIIAISPVGRTKTIVLLNDFLQRGILLVHGRRLGAQEGDPWEDDRRRLAEHGLPLPTVLHRVLMEQVEMAATGRLLVGVQDTFRRLTLHEGRVVSVETNRFEATEGLGSLLQAAGEIRDEDFQAAFREHKQSGERLGETLIAMGLLSERELKKALHWQLEIRLHHLLGIRYGQWCFLEQPTPPPNMAPLDVPALVYQFLKQHPSPMEEVMEALDAGRLETRFHQPLRRGLRLEGLGMSPVEKEILEVVRIHRLPPAKIAARLGYDPEIVRMVLAIFLEMEIIHTADRVPPAQPGTPPTRPSPNHAPPSRPPVDPSDWRRFGSREAVEKALATHNCFDLMQVHWSASPRELESVCQARLEAVQRHVEGLPAESRPAWETIVHRYREAVETLTDRERRVEYRRQVIDPAQRTGGALLEFERGEMAMFLNKDYDAALAALELAHELDPEGDAIACSLRLAQAFKAHHAGQAERYVQLAQAVVEPTVRSPRSEHGWLYLGYLHQHQGKPREAAQAFLRAYKINPNNTEARKELNRLKAQPEGKDPPRGG